MELQNKAPWYEYLDKCQQELVSISFSLIDRNENLSDLKDFSFMVFPMAKAYEGFLKKVFYDLQLINKETYEGRHFRIGRALNPDVGTYKRDDNWLYDNVESRFGKQLARQLWNTWLSCRNRVFHYFSDCEQFLSFDEACARIEMIQQAMEAIVYELNEGKNYAS